MPEKNEYAHLLHEGETILWEGRPEKRLLPTRRMLLTFLLILVVVVVSIPWASDSWESLPALLAIMGGFMLFFLLLLTIEVRLRIAREIYLLTDCRAMTVVRESKGFALRDVKLLRNINRISVQREGKGCATIYIGPQTRFEHYDWLFVPDGEKVAELIRRWSGAGETILRN